MSRLRACAVVAVLLVVPATAGPRSPSPVQSAHDHALRGFVMPSREVELAAPLEEILLRVEVEETQRVTAGQVLASLDDQLQQVVVEAARVRAGSSAEVERTALDVEEAQLTLTSMETAFERNAVRELELTRARVRAGQADAAHTAAKEDRELAKVNLRLEERRLDRYHIRAPFDGTVIRILAEEGAMLNETDKILLMADLDPLEAQLNLPVGMYGSLEVGARYTLIAAEPIGRELQAVLKTISPIIDTASQTFRCVFSIPNPDERLPAGFTVHLKVDRP